MLINENPNYNIVLQGLEQQMREETLLGIMEGRTGIVNWLTQCLLETNKVGPKSIEIFQKDINTTIDKVFGYSFK